MNLHSTRLARLSGSPGRWDGGLVIALALALLAASAFIVRPGLPRETDAELHVYRAAELGYVLRGGVIYTRWAPNFYYAYGYPIFNYYAPLTYYLANLFDVAPAVDIVDGVRAVFVLGFLLAAVGAYLLGRELFSAEAGVLAAACYCFAPYLVFIDPHARGNLAEHFALCLLPLAFYYHRRLAGTPGARGAFAGSVLALGALVLSHNLIGLVSGVLIACYVAWQALSRRDWRASGWGALALVVALCLTSFFWLPALAERHAVKLEVIGPGHFDFHEHFLTPGELLASSMKLDLGSAAPRFWLNLGLAQWVLALAGIGACLRLTRERRAALFFAVAGFVLALLLLPVSALLWELVPGMEYLQFPWRLLGPAALMLAVCAGAGLALLPAGRWRQVGLGCGVLAVLLLALPLLYPPEWEPDFGGTSPPSYLEWEVGSLALGTTSTGDYVPATAALAQMGPAQSLLDSYGGPGPVDKVDRAWLPDWATVEVVEHGPLHDRLSTSADEGFLLRLYTFDFPGWRAYVDGDEVPIDVTEPEGFISVWVPAGERDVLVRFGNTPVRTASWVVALIGVACLVGIAAARPGFSRARQPAPKRLNGMAAAIGLGGLVLFAAVKLGIVDQRDWLRYRSEPGQALPADHPVDASFDGLIELLGYDLPRQEAKPGGVLSVVLYWRAETDVGRNYQSFVHMTPRPEGGAPLGAPAAQDDHLNPGGYPTARWGTARYVWDEYKLDLPADLSPGEYVLSAGLYLLEEGSRLDVYDETGALVGDSCVFASVIVLP